MSRATGFATTFNIWRDFVRNTADNATAVAETPSSFPYGVLFGILGGSLFLIVAVVLVIVLRTQLRNRWAPRHPPVTIVFTGVEDGTKLWEKHAKAMQVAMDIHHAVIRNVIQEHHCYEVKVTGDSFMIACPTIAEALLLSIAIQKELNEAPWPESMQYPYDTFRGCSHWRGLRVRIGLQQCGEELSITYDVTHQRYDYYGHNVNLASRIESRAAGGQILICKESWTAIQKDECYDAIQMEATFSCVAKHAELKGIQDPIHLIMVLPNALQDRSFAVIEDTAAETVDVMTLSDTNSTEVEDRDVIFSTLFEILDCVNDTKLRGELIDNVLARLTKGGSAHQDWTSSNGGYAVRRARAAACLLHYIREVQRPPVNETTNSNNENAQKSNGSDADVPTLIENPLSREHHQDEMLPVIPNTSAH